MKKKKTVKQFEYSSKEETRFFSLLLLSLAHKLIYHKRLSLKRTTQKKIEPKTKEYITNCNILLLLLLRF